MVFSGIFKQSKPRLWVGAVRDMMQRAQSYYGIFNALIALATLYTVREVTIHKHFPWMNFLIFIGAIAICQLVVILLDYKLVYPSQIAFHQHEAYKHRSLVRRDLEATQRKQQELSEKLDQVLKAMGEGQDAEEG